MTTAFFYHKQSLFQSHVIRDFFAKQFIQFKITGKKNYMK